MRIASSGALIAVLAGVAHADQPPDPATTRDAFGFSKPKTSAPPIDCKDGLDFGCAQATDPFGAPVPYALSTWLPSSYLLTLPVADATQDQVASYALGASRDETGVTFANANGLENRWTIDGAPADSVRTGAVDTRIPLTFLDGIFVTAGGFSARDRTSLGGTIDARLIRGGDEHELDARVWAGWSADARQPPIANNSYLVRRVTLDPGPDATASIVAKGPLGALWGGKAWYAAGIAPTILSSNFAFTAASLVDGNNDGRPDGAPGQVGTLVIEQSERRAITWSVPVLARAGLDSGPHHLDLSFVGSGSTTTRYLQNATLQAGGIDSTNWIGDGIATYRGEWQDTHARLQLAWHRNMHRESAHDPAAAAVPQLLSAYVPSMLAEDPRLALHCADGTITDQFPMLTNCPIPIGWFASGGAGALTDTTADRPSVTADLAHRFGANVVRLGATGEDSRLVTETHFTGAEEQLSLFDGEVARRRFVDPNQLCPDDPLKACPYIDRSTLTFHTRYTAAYVEDTWRAAPDLVVDGGLRWELMWVGPVLHFSDELAPRLGVAWDPLGGGRSRVWTSMGRSFAMLPAGLGSTILRHDRVADDVTFSTGSSRSLDTGAPLLVVDGIEPVAQDELTAGAQFAISSSVRVTGWLQGRWLRRGIESTPDGFDNPGRLDDVQPASRDTTLLALELETNPISKLALRVGYMYGHTSGSWVGAFDPREGAVLFNSTDFDVTSLNQRGPLPTDLGQRVFIEAVRRGSLGSVNVYVSTRLTLQSGRPRDAIGDGVDGIIYLIPRGEAGHGPMQSLANVRLAASWSHFDFTLDFLNLFDRREATNVDPIYAGGAIDPIQGGTLADLVFLKNEAGAPAVRRTGYDLGTAFQAPFSAVLGVHRVF